MARKVSRKGQDSQVLDQNQRDKIISTYAEREAEECPIAGNRAFPQVIDGEGRRRNVSVDVTTVGSLAGEIKNMMRTLPDWVLRQLPESRTALSAS